MNKIQLFYENVEKSDLESYIVTGNPTDEVLGLVTKTNFHIKIIKFVTNFEKSFLN